LPFGNSLRGLEHARTANAIVITAPQRIVPLIVGNIRRSFLPFGLYRK
jgi:hypothetical protein